MVDLSPLESVCQLIGGQSSLAVVLDQRVCFQRVEWYYLIFILHRAVCTVTALVASLPTNLKSGFDIPDQMGHVVLPLGALAVKCHVTRAFTMTQLSYRLIMNFGCEEQ